MNGRRRKALKRDLAARLGRAPTKSEMRTYKRIWKEARRGQ